MRELDSSTDLDPSFHAFPSTDEDHHEPAPADGVREGLPKTYRPRHVLRALEKVAHNFINA